MSVRVPVIGPKVNMAARLMMNYPGKLSCDEETHHRSSLEASHFHDLPEIQLKIFELLEFVVFNLNFVPYKELSSVSLLIKAGK